MLVKFFLSLNFTALAIVSAVCGAVANILARTLLSRIRTQDMLAINFLIMTGVMAVFSPFFYRFTPSLLAVQLILLIALIDTLANYFFFKTFELSEASSATPILSLAPAFTFFFSWIFLGEQVRLETYMMAAAIIFLTLFFSLEVTHVRKFTRQTLGPALAASVLYGISAIPSKFLLVNLQAINAPTLYMFRGGLIALMAMLVFGFSMKTLAVKQYEVLFFRGLFVIVQWVLLYYALSLGSAGVSVTLANITPIFVFIFGVIFLREKPTLEKLVAAVLILVLSIII